MSGAGLEEARAYLGSKFPTVHGAYFECTGEEGDKAFLHRFAVAGAAIRYRAIQNDQDWFERLPLDVQTPIIHSIYYGHFFCHVFHQDYIVAKGHDTSALERKMWKLLDARGAEYPAEHNVGHLYAAKPSLANHYRALDPCNALNPGIGCTSKLRRWQ